MSTDREQIRARLAAATYRTVLFLTRVEEDPSNVCIKHEHWDLWRQEGEIRDVDSRPGSVSATLVANAVNVGCYLGERADAELFQHARADLASLLSENDALRARVAELEQALDGRASVNEQGEREAEITSDDGDGPLDEYDIAWARLKANQAYGATSRVCAAYLATVDQLRRAERKARAFDALSEPGARARVSMMATKNCPNPPMIRYAEVTLPTGAHASRTSGRASLLEAVEAAGNFAPAPPQETTDATTEARRP